VEPAIGKPVPLPAVLAEAITRPRHSLPLTSDYADLRALLRS
jgi:threonine synthase